jgi:predicted MFS family arabinose efflux permease
VGGAVLLTVSGWRTVFIVVGVLAATTLTLTSLFVPEMLPSERRSRLSIAALAASTARILDHDAF